MKTAEIAMCLGESENNLPKAARALVICVC